MVSHGNLIQNSEYIKQAFELTSQSVSVTWLPSFHDMGLIDGILQPIYSGFLGVVMSPAAFVQKPIRWLRAISHYRATHCGGPNFGYDLCVRKITPEQRQGLDLSSWTSAYSGAEPVRQETLEQFVATFAPYGFRRQFFYPCYGMAEATLMVSGGLVKEEPVYCPVQADALEENRIVAAPPETDNVRTIVGCGRSWLDAKIAIVDPESLTQCAPGEVGEIWVSGESVAQGYWQRPDATQATFAAYLADTGEGPFLRTGDLGFLQGKELFVTGRLKDVIIVRGRNHYPQDIELTAEKSHPSLRPNCGAAFTVEVDGEEQLVVAQEVERTHLRKLNVDEVTQAIRKAVASEHELQVHAIALLKTNSIPKTSSGKIQRHACRKDFLAGNLNVVGEWSTSSVPTPDGTPDASSLAAQLHNALYGPLRVQPLPLPADAAPVEATPAQTSKTRADRLVQWLRDYAQERLNSQLIDQRRCIPPYIVLDLGNRGVLGMQIPESYGGMGLSNYDALRVIKQLASIDLNLAAFVGVNHALGTRPILNYAREEVRREFLPLIARGLELASFAITKPGAGSNPRAIASAALPTPDGGWRLQGQKIWIGSGSWSGLLNVFVQLYDANHQPQGITGFVVRQGTPGLEQGLEALTMGMRGMVQNAVHQFLDRELGAPGVFATLFEAAQQIYDRCTHAHSAFGDDRTAATRWAALKAGELTTFAILQAALQGTLATIESPSLRRALDWARLHFEQAYAQALRSTPAEAVLSTPDELKTTIADYAAAIGEVEQTLAGEDWLDRGQTLPREAAVATKIAASELVWQSADALVQMLGGRGYMENNIAPQILRDARVLRIGEGPNESLKIFLGKSATHAESLHQMIRDRLQAPTIADQIRSAAAQVQQRSQQNPVLGRDRSSASAWAYSITGEVVIWGLLLAAVERAASFAPSSQLQRARQWARSHFERRLQAAQDPTPVESILMGAEPVSELISSYTETINDLEQTLAGEDRSLDPLLRQPTHAQDALTQPV